MIICPNLSNPEVAREFEELVQATSEQAAYHIWSLNNGNAIDRAPNGAPSNLFLTLLEYYDGDRTKAIQAKAKTYGNSFLNWFGDWVHQNLEEITIVEKETVNKDQNWVDGSEVALENGKYYYINELGTKKEITKKEYNDFNSGKDIVLSEKVHKEKKYDLSKVLDKNGEPLVMYHVTPTKGIKIFDRSKSKHAGFWFSSDPDYYIKDSQNNPNVAVMPCFLNIREPNEIRHGTFLDAVDGDVTQENLDNTRFDGWITRYIYNPEFYEDTYSESAPVFAMATSPNQIKSAIDNLGPTTYEGTFSRENDNIFDTLKSLGAELMKNCE